MKTGGFIQLSPSLSSIDKKSSYYRIV